MYILTSSGLIESSALRVQEKEDMTAGQRLGMGGAEQRAPPQGEGDQS